MSEIDVSGLVVVAAVAFSAPLLLGLAPAFRLPAVVLELVAGIVIGPSGLGWVEIESDDESLVPGGEWFQWHYDRWELPDAATELARNANSSQAFILDRNLAVQFHPEMNSAILASWMATGGTEEMNALGRDVDELVRQTAERDASNRERAHKLVDLFLDHVAVRSEVGHG